MCVIQRFESTVSKPTSNICAILIYRDGDMVEGLVIKTPSKGPLFGGRNLYNFS